MRKYKNRLTLLMITILVFYTAWWLLAQYQVASNYRKNISTLEETLVFKLKPNELKPYIKESTSAWVYVANTHDSDTGVFEAKLKKVVNQYQLNDYVVLCNISSDPITYTGELNTIFAGAKTLKGKQAPFIMYFEDGVLHDVLNGDKSSQTSIYKFFKKHNLIVVENA